jgi:hypothetical protein
LTNLISDSLLTLENYVCTLPSLKFLDDEDFLRHKAYDYDESSQEEVQGREKYSIHTISIVNDLHGIY